MSHMDDLIAQKMRELHDLQEQKFLQEKQEEIHSFILPRVVGELRSMIHTSKDTTVSSNLRASDIHDLEEYALEPWCEHIRSCTTLSTFHLLMQCYIVNHSLYEECLGDLFPTWRLVERWNAMMRQLGFGIAFNRDKKKLRQDVSMTALKEEFSEAELKRVSRGILDYAQIDRFELLLDQAIHEDILRDTQGLAELTDWTTALFEKFDRTYL